MLLDFKPQIKDSLDSLDLDLSKEDKCKIVEAIDIQLDRTVKGSIFNRIVNLVYSEEQYRLQELRKMLL